MKKLIGILIFIALVFFLYTTCPDKKDHTEALADSITEMISDELDSAILVNLISEIPEAQEFINNLGAAAIHVDDYLLLSVGKCNITGDEQVVSIGIGGHVFTFNDKIVQKGASIANKVKEEFNRLLEDRL